MSPLDDRLADYLALRRALGFKLARPSIHLKQFVAYLNERGEETVTIELALAWATLPAGGDPGYWGGVAGSKRRSRAPGQPLLTSILGKENSLRF